MHCDAGPCRAVPLCRAALTGLNTDSEQLPAGAPACAANAPTSESDAAPQAAAQSRPSRNPNLSARVAPLGPVRTHVAARYLFSSSPAGAPGPRQRGHERDTNPPS